MCVCACVRVGVGGGVITVTLLQCSKLLRMERIAQMGSPNLLHVRSPLCGVHCVSQWLFIFHGAQAIHGHRSHTDSAPDMSRSDGGSLRRHATVGGYDSSSAAARGAAIAAARADVAAALANARAPASSAVLSSPLRTRFIASCTMRTRVAPANAAMPSGSPTARQLKRLCGSQHFCGMSALSLANVRARVSRRRLKSDMKWKAVAQLLSSLRVFKRSE